ncbi:MAG: enoyl-CoA hydratase-related protein [Bacteroidota bacterium]
MSSILFEQIGQVGKITLNRPESYNSFNKEMAVGLQSLLDQCAASDDIRCLYITGAGKAFSAGQDLVEVTSENAPEIGHIVSDHYNPIISKIRSIEKPVVAGVNGVAAGAGCNIAIACDIIIASEKASFVQAFSKIGLVPDSGGTYFLPRIIGFHRATAMMMLSDKMTVEEAKQIGLVHKVFPQDAFEEEAIKVASRLSNMPTKGLGLTKRALNYSCHNDLDTQLGIEEQLQSNAALSQDYKEGVDAFLEKRAPNFTGK